MIEPIGTLRLRNGHGSGMIRFAFRSSLALPFLWRFLTLAALAVSSLVTGAFSPFVIVYFSRHLRMPLERIDIVVSFSHLVQVLALLAAPLIFRKFGLVGIVYTQIETGPAKK